MLSEEQKANFQLLVAGFCRKFATLPSGSKLPGKQFSAAWMKLLSNFRSGKSSQERLIAQIRIPGPTGSSYAKTHQSKADAGKK